jgi:hypothetical protein
MTMEAVAQQVPPQNGGFFTYIPGLGRVVCVETDCGGSVVTEDAESLARVEWLNKNFNMSPCPGDAFRALVRLDQFTHLAVRDGAIYPQVPQGDQNFNLQTVVVAWEPVRPIRNLKILAHGAPTLLAMQAQDRQDGFLGLAGRFGIPTKN